MSTGFEPADALAICLGMAGHSSDVELLLSRLERRPDDLSVIEALGILGSAASVPHLLWLLDSPDDKVKEAAGNALDLMSGLHARERVMRFESDEWDEPREIEHVNTSSTFWTRWWHRQSGRLDRNRRWRRGEHLSIRSFIDELEDPSSSYFNRSRAYMELCLHASANIPFEADWFVRRQLIAINEWRAWWAEQERR